MEINEYLFCLTPELDKAIDEARGQKTRSVFLEHLLWKHPSIKKAAQKKGIKNPDRPLELRGRPRKQK